MTRDLMEEARAAVGSIFGDLRDRRFLKWLFKSEPSVIGDFPDLRSLDLEVQDEIREAWAAIIATALAAAEARGREEAAKECDAEAATGLLDAREVQTLRRVARAIRTPPQTEEGEG